MVDRTIVAGILDAQVTERLHAEVAEHPGEPTAQVVALEGTVLEHYRETVGEEAERAEVLAREAAVTELGVVQRQGDVGEPVDRLTAQLQGGDQGCHDRARGGAGDAWEAVAGPGQRGHCAGQRNALDATAFEHEVGRELWRHWLRRHRSGHSGLSGS